MKNSRVPPSLRVCRPVRQIVAIGMILGGWGCGDGSAPNSAETSPPTAAPSTAEVASSNAVIFTEEAAARGLDFHHFNGMTGEYYMAEVTGAGAALFDYDNDGDLDAYLVQGTMLGPGKVLEDALFPPRHDGPLVDRLYRNELAETGELRFTDVTPSSGDLGTGYGMGVAAGDYDNDGFVDLYLTHLGPNQLLRNRGDGTFEDVTGRSGTGDPRWSVAASFVDYDRDGWLDLFIGNYVDFPFVDPPQCLDSTGAQDYCGPGNFTPESDRLLRNRGDGTFEDVGKRVGILTGFGPALGVVAADMNGDKRPDLYVANDQKANNLWLQQADGTFIDDALIAGASVNGAGQAEASMGVDAADVDHDGDLDLFMTHLITETNTLYLNDGQGLFEDRTLTSGLGPPSRTVTSFGTGWFDYDNDGWLDLLVVNGAVKKIENLARLGDPFPLHLPNQLFRNLGEVRFEEVTSQAGDAVLQSEVSRGVAFGDIDNDGDADVLIANNNGPARLLINQVGQRQGWLGVRLLTHGRAAQGARAAILRDGRPVAWQRVRVDGSYCSASDPRLIFGYGPEEPPDALRVHWPDGTVEDRPLSETGRYLTLQQEF